MTADPYRAPPATKPCPRCSGRFKEAAVLDALVLDCTGCGGFFVPKPTMDALGVRENQALRLAFPRRPRAAEPEEVRYLQCPACDARMNRVNFGKTTGVIVDICKEDGVWLDVGEIDAVIRFIEDGGLDRYKQRQVKDRATENERLRAEWRREHQAAERATLQGRKQLDLSDEGWIGLSSFFSWFD